MWFRYLALAAVVSLTGCASIFNGPSQPVTIQSVPDGSTVSVRNRAGEEIHVGATPVTLTLKRGAGYFKSEIYTLKFSKPGFSDKELTVQGSVSGWYFGNILLGGVLGMVVVDPLTGGMYAIPDKVSASLDAAAEPASSAAVGAALPSLRVVAYDSLTDAQKQQARYIGQAN